MFCLEPPYPGPGEALLPRFFFNTRSGLCEAFVFGGGKAKLNNFLSKDECTRVCRGKRPALQTQYKLRLPALLELSNEPRAKNQDEVAAEIQDEIRDENQDKQPENQDESEDGGLEEEGWEEREDEIEDQIYDEDEVYDEAEDRQKEPQHKGKAERRAGRGRAGGAAGVRGRSPDGCTASLPGYLQRTRWQQGPVQPQTQHVLRGQLGGRTQLGAPLETIRAAHLLPLFRWGHGGSHPAERVCRAPELPPSSLPCHPSGWWGQPWLLIPGRRGSVGADCLREHHQQLPFWLQGP